MDLECPFVGRTSYFEILLDRWDDLHFIGVYGLRSIGKSRFVKQLLKLATEKFCDDNITTIWVELRNLQSLRQIFLMLAEKFMIQITEDDNELSLAVLSRISQIEHTLVVVFDNAEDAIDSDLKSDFVHLCKQIANQNPKVKVIMSSTSQLSSNTEYPEGYYDIELSPLSAEESKALLQISAPSIDFGIYLDKLVELCEGLPLALLMTGSELEEADGLLEPCDMVELLNKCRLKVLSQDLYPIQERIAPMYREFLNRLSSVLKEKLGILSYIPGTFSLQQAAKLLDDVDEVDTMKETLMPIYQRHVVQYNTPTQRFDIHGILKDCISEFLKIQNLPEIRKRYCKMFSELMQEICEKMESDQYTEALCMYNMEQQNFQKLMTDVIYTTEDTYPVYVNLATSAFPTVSRFVGVDSFTFIENVLDLTRTNKSELDEAFVSTTYANVLTNMKGNFIEGEKNYLFAISVMKKFDLQNCVMKVRAHQGLGWNLGCQGKSIEALRILKMTLQMESEMGMDNEELMLQTLQSLAVFHTYSGFLEEGEMYHHKVLKKRREVCGSDDNPSIGACFNNMGILYRIKGDYSKALEYFTSGLEIKRKTKATDKAIVLSINNVAISLSDNGKHNEGMEMLGEAFDLVEKYPGFLSDCKDLTNETMGQICLRKCEYNKAIIYLKRSIKGRFESSPTHACLLEERALLAEAYIGLKQNEDARSGLLETLQYKNDFIREMPQNEYVYKSYKTLMQVSKNLQDSKGMEVNFTHCKAELYRLINFFEDLGNLTKSKEFEGDLKGVQKIYNDFKRGRRG